jgi:hypothetical protein
MLWETGEASWMVRSELQENKDVQEFCMGLSEVGRRKSYRDVTHQR